MKITKRQLRRIIKEEKRKILREQEWPKDFQSNYPHPEGPENDPDLYVNLSDDQLDALDALQDALELCRSSGVASADIMDTVQAGMGS